MKVGAAANSCPLRPHEDRMNGEATKLCPLCAETIKPAAKICPYCQTRQNRWSLRSQEIAALISMLVPLAIAAGLLAWVNEDPASEGTRFARHRRELSVGKLALDWAGARGEPALLGVVTNAGSHPWRVEELEVRFADARGNFFDALQLGMREPFVVEPSQDHAFRVSLGPLHWTNVAVTAQARVQSATDGRLLPKSP